MGYYDDDGNHILVPCQWKECEYYIEIPGKDIEKDTMPYTPQRCWICSQFVKFYMFEPKRDTQTKTFKMGETIMGELGKEVAQDRETKHAAITSSINRLKRAKIALENLLAEVIQSPQCEPDKSATKEAVPSLSGFLTGTADEIDKITDGINQVRSELHEALF